jgi:hypothetical protein
MKVYGVTSPDDNMATTHCGAAITFFFDEVDRLYRTAVANGEDTTTLIPLWDEVDRIIYDPVGTRYVATVGDQTVVLEVIAE